jgi:hypothetical protein
MERTRGSLVMVRGFLIKSIPKLVSIFEHHAVVLKFLAS